MIPKKVSRSDFPYKAGKVKRVNLKRVTIRAKMRKRKPAKAKIVN